MANADYVPPVSQMVNEISTLKQAVEYYRTTLRDQMAMAALTGLMATADERTYISANKIPKNEWRANLIKQDAEYCYQVADAMMAAREGREE